MKEKSTKSEKEPIIVDYNFGSVEVGNVIKIKHPTNIIGTRRKYNLLNKVGLNTG